MRKIPYHKCAICNSYSKWHETQCVCGNELPELYGVLRDIAEDEEEPIYDEKLYVQKCSNCGALNVTKAKETPVTRCLECDKIRIRKVEPIEYVPLAEEKPSAIQEPDEGVSDWDALLAGITEALGETNTCLVPESIKLVTCEGYEQTVRKEDTPYMLGRSARMSQLLSEDLEVGNEHCMILMQGDNWFVQDNHSQNGTLVNERDIGDGGKIQLRESDTVKLGHRSDSIKFKVVMDYENR